MSFERLVRAVVVFLIQLYRYCISPIFPRACRFEPSCSRYGLEAVQRHGVRRGLWLTVKRVARCHPFGASGFDPVPEGTRRGP